jgi:hypothetical protein
VQRAFVLVGGFLAVLVSLSAASAAHTRTTVIEPHERVGGMLVVRGTANWDGTMLFGVYCRPDIVKSGRYRRTCLPVPEVDRLFVGPGLFAPNYTILDRVWDAAGWRVWIDGERVGLDKFGTRDRMLYRYPPADGRDVILREWSIALVRPTPGRHTIRYRVGEAGLTVDATWEFTVVR